MMSIAILLCTQEPVSFYTVNSEARSIGDVIDWFAAPLVSANDWIAEGFYYSRLRYYSEQDAIMFFIPYYD